MGKHTSLEQCLAGGWHSVQIAAELEEFRRFASAPLELDDRSRAIQSANFTQAAAVDFAGSGSRTSLYLDEHDIEEVAALQQIAERLGGVLPDGDEIHKPRHSALLAPRKEANFQRLATRELNARKIISARRPVACAFTSAEIGGAQAFASILARLC